MGCSNLNDATDVEEDRGSEESPFATEVFDQRVSGDGTEERTGLCEVGSRRRNQFRCSVLRSRHSPLLHTPTPRRRRAKSSRMDRVDVRKTEMMLADENSPKSLANAGSLSAVPMKDAQ
jgi:hypothetical protein